MLLYPSFFFFGTGPPFICSFQFTIAEILGIGKGKGPVAKVERIIDFNILLGDFGVKLDLERIEYIRYRKF